MKKLLSILLVFVMLLSLAPAALARYLAKWPDYQDINQTNADVNADGKVNPADRAYLARHLAKWPAYAVLGVPV